MNLRVSRVSQLIHGAPVGEPVANTAYVTAIMQIEDENDEMVEYRFTRQISGTVLPLCVLFLRDSTNF